MPSKTETKLFLQDFKAKMKIWDVYFLNDRQKNSQALLMLDITPKARKNILEQLEVQNYSEGPHQDTVFMGSEMWIFGKMIKEIETYIKITMGRQGSSVLCISFHPAEYPMKYPFI